MYGHDVAHIYSIMSLLYFSQNKSALDFCYTIKALRQLDYLTWAKLYLGMDGRADIRDQYGRTLLHALAYSCLSTEPLEYVLASGAAANAKSGSLSDKAESNVLVNIKDMQGLTPLHAAASNASLSIIKLLAQAKGANINIKDKEGITPLHIASQNTNPEVMCYLLQQQPIVDSPDIFGKTALHYAAKNQNVQMVQLLLKAGADVNRRDMKGRTPLHAAAASNANPAVAHFLIRKRAEINVVDRKGNTLLHSAAKSNTNPQVLKFFLKKGILVNQYNRSGDTALHTACFNSVAFKTLLSEGADPYLRNNKGKMPMHLVFDATPDKIFSSASMIQVFIAHFERNALHAMSKQKERSFIDLLIGTCLEGWYRNTPVAFDILVLLSTSGLVKYNLSAPLAIRYLMEDVYHALARIPGCSTLSAQEMDHLFTISSSLRVRLRHYFFEDKKRSLALQQSYSQKHSFYMFLEWGAQWLPMVKSSLDKRQLNAWTDYFYSNSHADTAHLIKKLASDLPYELRETIKQEIVLHSLTDYLYIYDHHRRIDRALIIKAVMLCLKPRSELWSFLKDCVQLGWRPPRSQAMPVSVEYSPISMRY